MHNEQKVTDHIYWIGGNDFVSTRFENLIPISRGISYNSYFIDDEKTAVLDTVDSVIRDVFMDNVSHLLHGRQLDYIVINHMEPDHSGSLLALARAYPEAKIIATPQAQYSGHMSSLFFEEIYCFFLKKCNLNTPPGKLIFSNIFRRSIFLFQRYHYFVIGIQLMFIQ